MKPLRALFGLTGTNKTFKPLRTHSTRNQQQMSDFSRHTLGSGDVISAIALPEGCDFNEWLATNVVDFYNTTSLLMGTLQEGACTSTTCPSMTAGARFEYLWSSENPSTGIATGKPFAVPATTYISNLFDWISAQLSDENRFPTTLHLPFPSSFRADVRKIFRRLFRVYAHLYHHHTKDLEKVSALAHLTTSYQHFLLFVTHHRLVDPKELEPLKELNDALIEKAKLRPTATTPLELAEGEDSKAPTPTTRVNEGGGDAGGGGGGGGKN
jgi:MOB kinase activator 1